jgi:TfoX/Sxy family transcriptional regulator of competence genes
MTKPAARAGADRLALYDALLATHPDIERKGAAMPYTSVNGNMFSLLTADGTLALRLPTPEREAFLRKYKTALCVQYGAVMQEYVSVPATLLANTRQLAKYLTLSFDYARSLKPKATTKKKATTRKA